MEFYKLLEKYGSSNNYPFHMPGHKRNQELMPFPKAGKCDITEIEGFDNLHKPQGIIKEAMDFTAKLCGAEHTYFLVNGSTVGNLAGILASTNKGDSVLLARNCHKSVYNAVFLNELKPLYIYPENVRDEDGNDCGFCGEVLSEDIEASLKENPEIKMVVITSPTYEGIISDIKKISAIVHKYGKILMVDEAHGAHLGLWKGFSPSAVTQGADLVVQSPHKTLTAYTQSGVLHLNENRVDREKLEMYLSILQSSSPSYVLMAGLDRCYHLIEDSGEELFLSYNKRLDRFYIEAGKLKRLKVFCKDSGFDRSKIIVFCRGTALSGKELGHILREKYSLEAEMCSSDYVLLMTGIGDRQEGFDRLITALGIIDDELNDKNYGTERIFLKGVPYRKKGRRKAVISPAEAFSREREWVTTDKLEGRIAADYLYLYPPGIPIIVPGEIFDRELLEEIKKYQSCGLSVEGLTVSAAVLRII